MGIGQTVHYPLYAEGFEDGAFAGRATVVNHPSDSDVAIVRLGAPWTPQEEELFFHQARLSSCRMSSHGSWTSVQPYRP